MPPGSGIVSPFPALPTAWLFFWSKRNDIDLDFRLLKVGALLHDIGRCRTQHPILHGVEGFRLLSSLGHDREAFICASHVLCGMGREEASRPRAA